MKTIEEQRLQYFEPKVIRLIFERIQLEEERYTDTIMTFLSFFQGQTVTRFVKPQRMRWLGWDNCDANTQAYYKVQKGVKKSRQTTQTMDWPSNKLPTYCRSATRYSVTGLQFFLFKKQNHSKAFQNQPVSMLKAARSAIFYKGRAADYWVSNCFLFLAARPIIHPFSYVHFLCVRP